MIRFFPSLANTLVMILFSRKLEQSSYGVYQNFWVQLLVLSTIATAGIQSLVITYQKDFIISLLRKIKGKHYGLFFCWLLLLSIVFASLQFGFSVLITSSFLFFYAITIIAEAILIAYRKFKMLIVANLFYTLVFIALHLGIFRYHFSLEQLFLCLMVLVFIKAIICLGALRAEHRRQKFSESSLQYSSARSLWLHLGVNDVVQIIFRWIDKFILGFILSKELFAIYFNGSVDIPFLPLLLGAAGSAVLMQLAVNNDASSSKDTVALMHRSSQLLSSFVFPLFFFLVAFRYEIFSVVFTEKYLAAVPIFFAAVMVIPLRAYNFTTILQNRHKGALINAGAIMDLILACALIYPLYKIMGLPGVALSFVISTYLQAIFYLIFTARLLNVNAIQLIPWRNWLLKFIVFGCSLISIHYVAERYLTQRFVLLLGIICMLLMAAISLIVELKATNKQDQNNFEKRAAKY